jgi:hypothetical protein
MHQRYVRIIGIFANAIRHGLSLLVHALLLSTLWEKKRRSNSNYVELRRLCRFARNAIVAGKQMKTVAVSRRSLQMTE